MQFGDFSIGLTHGRTQNGFGIGHDGFYVLNQSFIIRSKENAHAKAPFKVPMNMRKVRADARIVGTLAYQGQ
jgi:hypothetical protein